MARMVDIFHQEAFAEINRDGSKLRTYAKIKQERGISNYLSSVTNVERRITLSKIRLSNHDLMIEKGRHQKLEVNQRNCPFCPVSAMEMSYISYSHAIHFPCFEIYCFRGSDTVILDLNIFLRNNN